MITVNAATGRYLASLGFSDPVILATPVTQIGETVLPQSGVAIEYLTNNDEVSLETSLKAEGASILERIVFKRDNLSAGISILTPGEIMAPYSDNVGLGILVAELIDVLPLEASLQERLDAAYTGLMIYSAYNQLFGWAVKNIQNLNFK